ncbi:hypothetical protein MANES_18G000051v8 [Manihot esculenta]|uniref:Uncharacterized protein n=1 Tax=Manihot esculenta TaxID=3983 RepID=A0ACB7FWG9_MANES|nr:hypothetical protein MANES_18G000051v8 [Manihot esculenta]
MRMEPILFHQVIKTEGWGGLYSGLKPSLFGTAASQGIYYYFYQVFKNRAEAIAASRKAKGHGDGTVGMFSWLVVAAMAGSLNVLLTNPIWVLVTRTLDAVTKMIRYEGVLGFYKGMGTKIVQSVFAASVLFMVKEELVKAYMVLADKSKKVLLNLSK